MTTVTVTRKAGHIYKVEANGHTGYAEAGSDIVCAAVSALTQGALLGLKNVAEVKVTETISDGELRFKIHSFSDKTDAILETMLMSLEDISSSYPSHLKTEDIKDDQTSIIRS